MNMNNFGSRYGDMLNLEHQPHATFDYSVLKDASAVNRAFKLCLHRTWAKLRVAGNTDRATAQAFDTVMAALGLNVDQRTGLKPFAIVSSVDLIPNLQ